MTIRATGRSLEAVALAVGLAALAVCGCGRGAHGPSEDVSKLEVTRYRLNIDEAHGVARIVAEVRNFGEHPVREATVTAILRGPGDEQRGLNRTVVKDIGPNQTKAFSMTVTTHGRERDVDFRITGPEELEAEAAQ